MEAIINDVPSEYVESPRSKDSAKLACDNLKAMRVSSNCVNKVKA